MSQLTPEGWQSINNLAQRYNFSFDAVFSLLQSVINGNGSMAQFSHPEFGGSGQWMRGGMIMLGDMFNNNLKNSVGSLCQELADLVASQPNLLQTGSFQSQTQGNQQQHNFSGGQSQQNSTGNAGSVSLFVPPPPGSSGNWWPAGLQFPNSTGSQNNVRYAYFATIHRLAIEANGHVTLYDTLDHQIGGFSQQQSVGGSITFTSQYGLVDVNNLPVISIDNNPVQPKSEPVHNNESANTQPINLEGDIFATLERLADLKSKGIVTENEYNAKKAELLSRL
ncbi:MAG: SHOCT domain-containing protein [Methylicorpusculum sp.]|uniref:SHOCT domain-containing protein n=1 Tax=Methylicorpusculum sp. TaxID=2713644 RepID=UPI002719EB77|nr:SHOCT domain-containing protein [Methylicorpusculum sp.]MDO8844639.1 SHOCT domain-containing protein [Methylicorpusculum sp.]MDO8940459.1 SHOCT domain-containing protein [Methylicorpusculum sp.]MDP2202904.1 SHOCT domain-containing protein [Methylicorpusculum sp.]